MSHKVALTTLYILIMMLMLNSNSFLMFWALLELNMMTVCLLIMKYSKGINTYSKKNSIFYYFLFQTLGSLIMMFMAVSSHLSEWLSSPSTDILMALVLSIKMALFPFHFWMYDLVKECGKAAGALILVIQKAPMLFMAQTVSPSVMLTLWGLNLAIGTLSLMISNSILEVLVSSSYMGFIWLVSATASGTSMLSMFMISYFLAVFCLLKPENEKSTLYSKLWSGVSLVFLTGLPPISMFFVKLNVFQILSDYSNLFVVTLWLCSALPLCVYVNCILKIFASPDKNFYSSMSLTNKSLSPVIFMPMMFLY